MTELRLEQVLGQPRRLDVLCQIDPEPRTLPQVSRSLGQPISMVSYHLHVLRSAGLATEAGEIDGVLCFVASLAGQPAWVAGAIEKHRARGAGSG